MVTDVLTDCASDSALDCASATFRLRAATPICRASSPPTSNTLTAGFCVEALSEALGRFAKPGIFNTDQGAQFTSDEFTQMLRDHGIAISMDGRGRCHDNIFVERLWWTVKHEWVYLRPAADGIEQKRSLGEFFDWYNRASEHPSVYVIEEKRLC